MTLFNMRYAVLVLMLMLSGYSAPAMAQNMGLAGITTPERVGFAFYSLTRTPPPFAEWIKGMDSYRQAQPHIRIQMLDQENRRLTRGYAHYNTNRDLIMIHFAVDILGMDNPAYNPAAIPSDPDAPVMKKAVRIFIPSTKTGPYFPFQLGQQWIALIPQNIEASTVHPMTEEQYNAVALSTGMNTNVPIAAEAELILRPISADAKTPMTLDGLPMWLMMSDIASFSLLDRERKSLWDSTALWYFTEKTQEYMTLYGQ